MIDTLLLETIKSLMEFMKIHTEEKDVGWMYGKMRKLTDKTVWTIDDEKLAQDVIKRALEKTQEIKQRRSFYNNK